MINSREFALHRSSQSSLKRDSEPRSRHNPAEKHEKHPHRGIFGLPDFTGKSAAIQQFVLSLNKVAGSSSRILLLGDSGTGKELAAQWIHSHSFRAEESFVAVNFAAIPAELIESELFGHEKGAFTGADERKIGRFEQAGSGTLFLDEIGDLSLRAQAKLLWVLQENYFYRGGGTKPIPFQARVLAATNQHLLSAISKRAFRHDLYFRIAIIVLHVPSLSERRDDIPQLSEHYLHSLIANHHVETCSFTKGALTVLQRLNWPGNVRQLQNVVERVALLSQGPLFTKADVEEHLIAEEHVHEHARLKNEHPADSIQDYLAKSATFTQFKERSEAWFLQSKLSRFHWNVAETARELGMTRSALYAKIKKYALPLKEIELNGKHSL